MKKLPAAWVGVLLLSAIPSWAADEKNPRYWIDKGLQHANQKEFEAAERCYRNALALDKNNATAHGNLTFVYLNTNRPKAVLPRAALAIRHGNMHPGVYLNRAEAYRRLAADQKKYYDRALQDCDKVIDHKNTKLTPVTRKDVAEAYRIKAEVYDALKQPDLVKEMRRKAALFDR